MLAHPVGRPHSEAFINVCPQCAQRKLRSVLSASSEQAKRGEVMCPVHGAMSVRDLKQYERTES